MFIALIFTGTQYVQREILWQWPVLGLLGFDGKCGVSGDLLHFHFLYPIIVCLELS